MLYFSVFSILLNAFQQQLGFGCNAICSSFHEAAQQITVVYQIKTAPHFIRESLIKKSSYYWLMQVTVGFVNVHTVS